MIQNQPVFGQLIRQPAMRQEERAKKPATTLARRLSASASLTAVLIGSAAFTGNATTVIEEILVTAQKREQSAQDVGVAVTAFSEDEIRE